MTRSELELENAFFLFEPDIAQELADLLHPEHQVPLPIQTAALYLLEALVRQRSRVQEVSTALNLSAGHGILMVILRRVFADSYPLTSSATLAFVDALNVLLSTITANSTGGQLIISAGIVPAVVSFLTNRQRPHKRSVGKMTRILDNLIYSFASAFTSFCNANGISTLVERIGHEVQECLECGSDLPTANLLKDLLRFLHHMMQTAGTADRLRNLVETALPKTMVHIVRFPGLFGPSVYVYTINIMASFIHNEPTSLAILQEFNLPQTFLQAVKKHVPVSGDVINTLPNAFGAVCLNQAGLDYFTELDPFPEYFAIFTQMAYVRPLQESDVPATAGTGIDELIRHHPSLKTRVLECIKQTLAEIREFGKPDGLPAQETPGKHHLSTSTDPPPSSERVLSPDDMVLSQMIEAVCRFLEGLLQQPHHRQDLVQGLGVDFIFDFLKLPALPYDFFQSRGWGALVGLFKTVVE
ncbi:hypothetical protein BJ085DRAFT_20778, partial [Dimargaris cristalligena]